MVVLHRRYDGRQEVRECDRLLQATQPRPAVLHVDAQQVRRRRHNDHHEAASPQPRDGSCRPVLRGVVNASTHDDLNRAVLRCVRVFDGIREAVHDDLSHAELVRYNLRRVDSF